MLADIAANVRPNAVPNNFHVLCRDSKRLQSECFNTAELGVCNTVYFECFDQLYYL